MLFIADGSVLCGKMTSPAIQPIEKAQKASQRASEVSFPFQLINLYVNSYISNVFSKQCLLSSRNFIADAWKTPNEILYKSWKEVIYAFYDAK